MNTTRQATPGFKNQRGRIKAYRASGRMFGQAFHTDANWNVTRPPAKTCPCGYIMETYTQPCPQGHDWNSLSPQAGKGEKDDSGEQKNSHKPKRSSL